MYYVSAIPKYCISEPSDYVLLLARARPPSASSSPVFAGHGSHDAAFGKSSRSAEELSSESADH